MEERLSQIQSKAYRVIRESMDVDKQSQGWMDFGKLLDELRKPSVHGKLEEQGLWEIIMGTKDCKMKQYSSYQLFWYGEKHAALKIRFKPKDQDQPTQKKRNTWQGQGWHQHQ